MVIFLTDITEHIHARALHKELYKYYYLSFLYQLCNESNYPHFIDEDSEGQRVAVCLGMHS